MVKLLRYCEKKNAAKSGNYISHPSLPECQVSYFKIEHPCLGLLLKITWNVAVIMVLAQINYQNRFTSKMNKEPSGFAALC